jgi:hypothetical protein
MEAFGIFGFILGLMAYSVASQAMRELRFLRTVLRQEVDALRLEVRGKPPGQADSGAGAHGGGE